MKQVHEIRKVLDFCQPLVSDGGDVNAEVIWDTLRWVLDEDGAENPADAWLRED